MLKTKSFVYYCFTTDPVFSAPDFPKYMSKYCTVEPSEVLVRPLGRFHDQNSYKYQDNPFGAEHWFTFHMVNGGSFGVFKKCIKTSESLYVVEYWPLIQNNILGSGL
ncbi:hypothetical protein ABEB36_011214 [Hypothenemus hampei]|uniref:Uncharacterized protein n=1 Tax=Hypothenemus hampei TaxID=57062 RepID=A0ABD1EHF9_HYPHA